MVKCNIAVESGLNDSILEGGKMGRGRNRVPRSYSHSRFCLEYGETRCLNDFVVKSLPEQFR